MIQAGHFRGGVDIAIVELVSDATMHGEHMLNGVMSAGDQPRSALIALVPHAILMVSSALAIRTGIDPTAEAVGGSTKFMRLRGTNGRNGSGVPHGLFSELWDAAGA